MRAQRHRGIKRRMADATDNRHPKTPSMDVVVVDRNAAAAQEALGAAARANLPGIVVSDIGKLRQALARRDAIVVLELLLDDPDGIEIIRHLASLLRPPELVIFSEAGPRIRAAAARLARARGLSVRAVLDRSQTNELHEALVRPAQSLVDDARRAPFIPSAQDLRRGMAEGEISVLYQPKVNVSTLEPVSVEALARWSHPQHGAISPQHFISVAEYHSLIGPLTDIVVTHAFQQASEWHAANVPLRVAVNVSGASLANLQLPDHLAQRAADFSLDTQRITIEITETWFEQNPIDALDIMTRLRMKGFDLALDDFGTGHSTMLRLKQVPFSELKLDQSLIRGAADDPVARRIVASSIHLGQALGLCVIAEGVDNEHDWELIDKLGCDVAQGYFVARPMSAAALPDWHQRWEASRRI